MVQTRNMSVISKNLKHLRKQKGWTQGRLAEELMVKRPVIGAYEEERAEPKIKTLQQLAHVFDLTVDDLISRDLTKRSPRPSGFEVLAVTVNQEGEETISLVADKASAGYTNGYADPEFMEELPQLQLPLFGQGTFRAFEVKGDSMLPILSGSWIIGKYLEQWQEVKEGSRYIVVTHSEGILFKRMGSVGQQSVRLISDNTTYEPFDVPKEEVIELWEARAVLFTSLPEPDKETDPLKGLTAEIAALRNEVELVKSHVRPRT